MILLFGVLLISTSAFVWMQCTASSSLQQFQMNPNPVEYDSGRRRLVDEIGLPNATCFGSNPVTCHASAIPIGDGNREPISLTDLRSTFAWNEDVTITMGLSQAVRVRAINLFFYNIPSMGIGLPHEIELNWGTSFVFANNRLRHAVLGNSDLSQEDNTTRNVTIAAIADDSGDETNYTSTSITFRFSDTNPIRWLILSEIEICTDPVNVALRQDFIPLTTQGDEVIQLQPSNIQSQINLTCTVEIEGSFQWVWSGPAAVGAPQVLADTNRTSSITLTQLSTDSAGSYSCQAMYDPQSLPIGVTTSAIGSKTLTLQFENAAVTEALNNETVVASINSSVTLSCELYGYLPRAVQPQIIWRRINGGTISSNSPPYTITTSDGSKHIQNGGSTPGPSLVSSLTFDVMDESVAGMYTCSGPSNFQTFQFNVQAANSSSPQSDRATSTFTFAVTTVDSALIPLANSFGPQSDGAPPPWIIIGVTVLLMLWHSPM